MNFLRQYWAIWLTTIYVCFILGFVANGNSGFRNLELNAIGDFLAGVIGPVALLWLVKGFFQQTKALEIQADELRQSVDAQKEMARAASSDLDAQSVREVRNYWLEARRSLIDIEMSLSSVRTLTPSARKSRHAVLAASGLRNSGKRIKFDTWIDAIPDKIFEIETKMSEITPLSRIADGGPSVETLAALYELKGQAADILRDLNASMKDDDLERSEIRSRNRRPT